MTPLKRKTQLNAVLVEAITESLESICGSAAPSVFFFLEKNGSIDSKSSVKNLESFSEGLGDIFGFGSKVIEKKILEVLYIKLQLPQIIKVPSNFAFVKEVRKIFEIQELDDLRIGGDTTQRSLDRTISSGYQKCQET